MSNKQQVVKRASLNFIETLENINGALLKQNDILKQQVKKLKQDNYQLRDELMIYKFKEVQVGRTRSISVMSMDLTPIKRDVVHGLHFHNKQIEVWQNCDQTDAFVINTNKLHRKKELNADGLLSEYKRYRLHKLRESMSIGMKSDQSLAELHHHLEHLKVCFILK